jgi:hypothetical protein
LKKKHVEHHEDPDHRARACVFECNERGDHSSDYRDEALQGAYSAALKRGGSSAQQFCWRIPINQLSFQPASDGIEVMKGVKISTVENTSNGRGLAGVAFGTGRPSVSNDYLNDERMRPWSSRWLAKPASK